MAGRGNYAGKEQPKDFTLSMWTYPQTEAANWIYLEWVLVAAPALIRVG